MILHQIQKDTVQIAKKTHISNIINIYVIVNAQCAVVGIQPGKNEILNSNLTFAYNTINNAWAFNNNTNKTVFQEEG